LIVSTERIDDFLLVQEPIEIGKIEPRTKGARGVSFGQPRKKLVHQNEWFTKTIRVRLARLLDQVSTQETTVANHQITIKGHPTLAADISLGAAQSGSRGTGAGSDFYRALERQGLDMVNFSGTRGEAQGILEFTDIRNPGAVQDEPLEIEVDLGLSEEEYILPLTFDGEHILLVGEPEKEADGRTLIHIDHLPESLPDHRRSLGKALKLYFFKTYLKRSVNQLCWVEYLADGSVVRHEDGVADKVAAARNILILIHGIIGDSEGIAQGLAQASDASGSAVHTKFDLVLTYDYENLSTSIEKTARKLKTQLRDVGLDPHDDKCKKVKK